MRTIDATALVLEGRLASQARFIDTLSAKVSDPEALEKLAWAKARLSSADSAAQSTPGTQPVPETTE